MRGEAAAIGIAIVEHFGKFLVGARPPGVPLAGLAEFPGGKCRAGELPAECAARECLEETGLRVSPITLLLRCEHDYAHGRVDLHFWLCRPVDAGDVGTEHRGYRWVPREDLAVLDFPEANAPVIALLRGG
jgi:8-oxo-dGTP diphosphatase